MIIKLNGKDIDVEKGITLDRLLLEQNLSNRMCAVEKNLTIIPKEKYSTTYLEDFDSIEIATLCAGG